MLKRVCALISVLTFVVLVGCGAPETTPTTTPTSGGGDKKPEVKKDTPKKGGATAEKFPADKATGSIKGVVTLEGEAPKMNKIDMSGAASCAALHKDAVTKEDVVSKDGKLANVVVYVTTVNGKAIADTWSFDPATEEVTLDQKGCQYIPHVLAVTTDQPVNVQSDDDLAHNIHYIGNNPEFNESQQKAGSKKAVKFSEPDEHAAIACNIHGWMKAYLWVFPHKLFAVTKEDGSYEIKGVPAGDYEVAVWQESEGAKLTKLDPVKVKVGDKEAKEQNFTYKVK